MNQSIIQSINQSCFNDSWCLQTCARQFRWKRSSNSSKKKV